jgi:muramoyltetrapeptide carboxypeptidase LdcA involved in peptidoglycan recycling
MPSPSDHVELHYADIIAIIATTRNKTLLFSYLESYLNDLQRWLNEWRNAINISKRSAIIFGRAERRFIKPRPLTLFGESI